MKPQFTGLAPAVDLMVARPAAALPAPRRADRYAYEIKADGVRALARLEGGRVQLQSRQQRPLTRQFPELVDALLAQVPDGSALDAEVVVHRAGRFDFAALQRRLLPAQRGRDRSGPAPAALMVFDVLVLAGVDLRAEPYLARRERLERILGQAQLPLVLMPMTRDLHVARTWLHEHAAAGIEGLMLKHVRHGYLPRRRHWAKWKFRVTADAVVCGVSGSPAEPRTLLLALPSPDGQLLPAGQTVALPMSASRELGALLVPTQRTVTAAVSWSARRSVTYQAVEPTVVVEVDADVCFEGRRWRHPTRYLRWRADLAVADLSPEVP